MPRGGRRPGAGARKGNTNALTSMNHSPRARIVYEFILLYPDKRALAQLLVDNGVPLGRKLTPRHYSRAVEIVYRHFFDRSEPKQSTTIKQSHQSAPQAPIDPKATP